MTFSENGKHIVVMLRKYMESIIWFHAWLPKIESFHVKYSWYKLYQDIIGITIYTSYLP